MAHCFTLIPKGETAGEKFPSIDNKMCEHFGVPPHPNDWYLDWYNRIGPVLALGTPWKLVREMWDDNPDMMAAIDWLEQHYTVEAWREF